MSHICEKNAHGKSYPFKQIVTWNVKMTKNWKELENDSELCVKIISEQYYNILQTQQKPLNFVTLKGVFAAFLVINSIDRKSVFWF